VLVAADGCGAAVVGRAALGESYAALDPDRIADLRAALPAGATAIVLDAPEHVRAKIDPWGPVDPAALALMTSVKARFDPTGTCNPGRFVGGI
jgi:glycolate oxidase FAD binding subunit